MDPVKEAKARAAAGRLVSWSKQQWIPLAQVRYGDKNAQLLGGSNSSLWYTYVYCFCPECATKPDLVFEDDEEGVDTNVAIARERGQGIFNFQRTRIMSIVQFLLHSKPGPIDEITNTEELERLAKRHVLLQPQQMYDPSGRNQTQAFYLDDAMRFLGEAQGGASRVHNQVTLLKYEFQWGLQALQHGSLLSYDASTGCYKFLKQGGRSPVDVHLALNFVVELQNSGSAVPREQDVVTFQGKTALIPGYRYDRDLDHDIRECLPAIPNTANPALPGPSGFAPAPQGSYPGQAPPQSYGAPPSAYGGYPPQGGPPQPYYAPPQQPRYPYPDVHGSYGHPGAPPGAPPPGHSGYSTAGPGQPGVPPYGGLKAEPGLNEQGPVGPLGAGQDPAGALGRGSSSGGAAFGAQHGPPAMDPYERDPRQRSGQAWSGGSHMPQGSGPGAGPAPHHMGGGPGAGYAQPPAPAPLPHLPHLSSGGGAAYPRPGAGYPDSASGGGSSAALAPLDLFDWHRIETKVDRNPGYASIVACVWLESLLSRLGFSVHVIKQAHFSWAWLVSTAPGHDWTKAKYIRLCKRLNTQDAGDQRLVLTSPDNCEVVRGFLRELFNKAIEEDGAGLDGYVREALYEIETTAHNTAPNPAAPFPA